MKHIFLAAAAFGGLLASHPATAADFDFWHGLSGPLADEVGAICDQFNASQSQDKITCSAQGKYDELLQKATAAYRANKQPAIVMFYDVGTPTIMLSGAIKPISEVMKAAGETVDWSEYLPGALSYYAASDGTPLSLPFNASTLLFYTDKEKLAAVGVTGVPQTWEEVFEAARALKVAGDACPMVLQTNNAWRLLEQSSAVMGAPVASKQNGYGGLDAELVFDKTVHARLMKDFAAGLKEGILVDQTATRAGKATQAFATGECAMIMESTSGWGVFKAAGKTDIGIGKLPIYAGQTRHNTLVGGASLWAMNGFDGEVYKGIANFFAYLRSPEVQASFSAATGYIPVTGAGMAAFKADPEIDAGTKEVIRTGFESLNEPATEDTRGIRLGFYPQIRKAWAEEVSTAFAGGGDMDAALTKAVARGNDQLRLFQKTYPGATLP